MSLWGELLGDADVADVGQLGAINMICPPGDCQIGQGQIHQAVDWFNRSASATTQQKYGAALQVITDRRQAILDRYNASSTLPTSECCELGDLGKQAELLTAQMAAADNLAPPPSLAPPSSALDTLLKALAAAAIIGAGVAVVKAIPSSSPRRATSTSRRRRR